MHTPILEGAVQWFLQCGCSAVGGWVLVKKCGRWVLEGGPMDPHWTRQNGACPPSPTYYWQVGRLESYGKRKRIIDVKYVVLCFAKSRRHAMTPWGLSGGHRHHYHVVRRRGRLDRTPPPTTPCHLYWWCCLSHLLNTFGRFPSCSYEECDRGDRGVEPLTMMFFLKGLLPRVLRRDRADDSAVIGTKNTSRY